MRVDEIRAELRRLGVTGTSAQRKPELVKTLAKALRAEKRRGGAAKKTGPAAKKAGAAKKTGPAAKKTGPAAKKAGPAAKKAGPAAKKAGPAAKKAGAAKKTTAAARGGGRTTTTARAGGAKARGGEAKAGGGTAVRQGPNASRSLKYAQHISSPEDKPDRPGRSLVTTNHDVIRQWAEARNAQPAAIAGTEHDGRAGVITFNIPGFRESSRIQPISWDDWFRTFDERGLNLIYQEQMRDGRQSNFFRTENPNREDA